MNRIWSNRPPVQVMTASILLLVAVWQWGSAVSIHAKALLAQHLIGSSWEHRLTNPSMPGRLYKPWPWADTWPVARLQWRERGHEVDLFVLSGTDGSSLAFGPGHLHGSAFAGEGTAVFAGHRDTHFRFLERVEIGDGLRVQRPDGEWLNYRVSNIEIVDADESRLVPDVGSDSLVLVTCYPFDAIRAGGPLRYLVSADGLRFGD